MQKTIKKVAKKATKVDFAPKGDNPKGKGDVVPPVSLPPRMVTAIKNSPKGKLPAGLAKYMANKKKK